MTDYSPIWYQSDDGLRLFARHYRGNPEKPTLLCMHGLTRNSADFESFITTLNGDYPILVVDQRGRGLSEYDPQPSRYQIPVYAEDMFHLLEQQQLEQVIPLGTSMGGLIAMQMLAMRPNCIRALILNDIGAVIDARGLARIQSYVGMHTEPVTTWEMAAAQCRELNGLAFPDYGDEDWLLFARRLYRENESRQLTLAYDPAISQSNAAAAAQASDIDLWPLYNSLPDIPTLIIRGALSDILSAECLTQMRQRKSSVSTVEIPRRGHAPMLNEPQALEAIRAFLGNIR